MTRRIITMFAVTGLTVLAAAGCSVSAHVGTTSSDDQTKASAPVGDPAKLETLAEDQLEKQVGQRPDIDCGSDSIPLVVGKVVHCDLSGDGSSNHYDVALTFTSVEGTNVAFDIKVADAPKS